MAIKTSANTVQNLLIKIFGEKHRDYVIAAINWKSTVGEYLARYSKVIKVEKQVLFVAVENSTMMQEFILIRDDLKDRLNRKLPITINEIVFFILDESKNVRTGHRACPKH